MTIFVGVDWAEAHHDVCVKDDSGGTLAKRRVPDGIAGVRQFHELVAPFIEEPTEALVGIECQRPLGIPHWRPLEFPRDGHENPRGWPWNSPRSQLASGTTPLPEVASMKRTDSPSVTMTWAWCNSRSTSAEAMVFSMSWSKPEGCRLDERATERRS